MGQFQEVLASPGIVMGIQTPACDNAYAPVSAGCILALGLQYLGAAPSSGVIVSAWDCYVGNSDGVTGKSYQAYTACCRTPGR